MILVPTCFHFPFILLLLGASVDILGTLTRIVARLGSLLGRPWRVLRRLGRVLARLGDILGRLERVLYPLSAV